MPNVVLLDNHLSLVPHCSLCCFLRDGTEEAIPQMQQEQRQVAATRLAGSSGMQHSAAAIELAEGGVKDEGREKCGHETAPPPYVPDNFESCSDDELAWHEPPPPPPLPHLDIQIPSNFGFGHELISSTPSLSPPSSPPPPPPPLLHDTDGVHGSTSYLTSPPTPPGVHNFVVSPVANAATAASDSHTPPPPGVHRKHFAALDDDGR